MKYPRIILWILLTFVVLLAACQPAVAETDVPPVSDDPITVDPITEEPIDIGDPEDAIREILAGDVFDFHLVQLDMEAIVAGLGEGRIVLPLVNQENELLEAELIAKQIQLRVDGLREGQLRFGDAVESVNLSPEQNYRIGDCDEALEEFTTCGSLTILDGAQIQIGGILVHEDFGLSFFEPVDYFLGGDEYPGLHIFYNLTGTEPTIFEGDDDFIGTFLIPGDGRPLGLASPVRATAFKSTSIVLDGDVTFYNINTATVWSRQEEVLNAVAIVYGVIEPLSFENPNISNWGLSLQIKGQEVWVSGGPTTTNSLALVNVITDPNYFLLNPVNNDELHYLYVGYNVSGVLGRAAGIGSAAGFGGAQGNNHAFGEARSTQSLKTRWVVMAHEVGHVIGGSHGDGVTPGCTQFFFFIPICGDSIMPAGSASAPANRAPFFSDANDDNIANVLNVVLP